MHDNDCDCEFVNEQHATYLNYLAIEHENLINKFLKNRDILDAQKAKIDLLNEERTNFLENIQFLEFEHSALLDRNNVLTQEIENVKSFSSVNEIFHLGTKVLNEILDRSKSNCDKRGLGYINKNETPSSGETFFVKGKKKTLNQTTSLSIPSLCTHCKKTKHARNKCYTKFLERFESQMNMLMNDFNSLKNNILYIGKGRNLIKSLELNKTPLSHH